MDMNRLRELLTDERFPRSNNCDAAWVIANEMGPNALWLTEWLCEAMDLKPGMRVLDMGCGKAMSSIFLAKEFGVTVFANDLWISATDNWARIREAGVEDRVVPIHAEAHALPYADDFFDAVVSIDSYHYYGTGDLYLGQFIRHLKPGGRIGIVVPGTLRELDGRAPEHLRAPGGEPWWSSPECFSFHTIDWWRRHWTQTELVDIETAGILEDGWHFWLRTGTAREAAGELGRTVGGSDTAALKADQGRTLCLLRVVARKKEQNDE